MTTETKRNLWATATMADSIELTDNQAPVEEKEQALSTEKLVLELVENESGSRNLLVKANSGKPRGRKKGSGKQDTVLANYRLDRHIYDTVHSQTVNATACVNALLQYALDDLEKQGKTLLITN